jgi:hypothetical protein
MELKPLLERIESVQFATQVDIASGFRVFQRALEKSEFAQSLARYVQEHPQSKQGVYRRLLELLEMNDQPDYAHPYDPALAGYLYVLNRSDPALADMAARRILQTPQLWWAKRLANHILENRSKTDTVRMNWGGKGGPDFVFSSRDKAISYAVEIAYRRQGNREAFDFQARALDTQHIERMVS